MAGNVLAGRVQSQLGDHYNAVEDEGPAHYLGGWAFAIDLLSMNCWTQ